MKVIVKSDFYDLQEDKMRHVGEEFDVTKERLTQLEEFVEKRKAKDVQE